MNNLQFSLKKKKNRQECKQSRDLVKWVLAREYPTLSARLEERPPMGALVSSSMGSKEAEATYLEHNECPEEW